MNQRLFPIRFLLILFLWLLPSENLHAGASSQLEKIIGRQDAVLIADPGGNVLFSKNADKKLVPASTLKILTALVALHNLGPDYRFVTEFYLDQNSNLKIKGYGDPLLISEVVNGIAEILSARIQKINDLVLDDSYFRQSLVIPGITSSFQPYDAPNGALCVNFNTVYFKRAKNGTYVSAEPQTPLLPYVLTRIKASNLIKGRVIFSQKKNDITLYAGHLFSYFFHKAGIESDGRIRIGTVQKESDRLIFQYFSRFPLAQVISRLLEHSNNFMANQLLIAAGAKVFGPPCTLDKGVKAALSYAKQLLKTEDIQIVEGSGISRKNRISAKMMHKILEAFKPYHYLLHHENGTFYKTGTLSGISTRAGFIENETGALYPFVVFVNTKGKSAEGFMDKIRLIVESSL